MNTKFNQTIVETNGVRTVAGGGTGRTVGNYSAYNLEIHVSKDGNDTTGDGTLVNPVSSITKALKLVGAGKNTIIVHPGGYTENPTVTSNNTTITTFGITGATTIVYGTLALSAAARVAGLKMTSLTIAGSGNAYISNCTVDTQVIKSGTNYVEIINSELQCISGVQITGAGIVSIVGNKCWGVTVSNAAASVLIKDSYQVIAPSVTFGSLQFDGCAIFAASPASNAVTSSAGTNITLANSFVLNSAANSVERVSLSGYYSILNLVYDKANSIFTGINLNAIDYFSVINTDTLSANNTIYDSNGNSNQWNSVYSSQAYTLIHPTTSINPIYGNNTASGCYSNVAGGFCNTACGNYSTIVGGFSSRTTGDYSFVGGGRCNTASGNVSIVGGGKENTASGYRSTIVGGFSSRTTGDYSFVGGGRCNTASENSSTVSGGYGNTASRSHSTVSGGRINRSSGYHSTVSGGYCNTASNYYSTVGGGVNSTASGCYSNVAGGRANNASGSASNVSGGGSNTASGDYSSILGGISNNTNGQSNTFILGSNITASQPNFTYVNNLSATGIISASASNIKVSVINDSTNRIFTDADSNKVIHINTTTTSLCAVFPSSLSNGFNAAIMNIGTNNLVLSAAQLNSAGTTITTRYGGAFVYKDSNNLFAVGRIV